MQNLTAKAESHMQALMNANTVQAKISEQEKQELQDEEDFWTKETERANADLSRIGYARAVAIGEARAKAFVDSATDITHPDHNVNFPVFKTVYNLDAKAAEKNFVDQEVLDANVGPFQYRDSNYENRIKLKHKPQGDITSVQLRLFESLCKSLDQKWKSKGYLGDKKFISDLTEKFGLEPTKTNSDLAAFQPKD